MGDFLEEILQAKERLESIEKKFNDNEVLTLEELEHLFLFYQITNNEVAQLDTRFDYVRFRNLYLIYSSDLDFKSTFYKRNPNKRAYDYLDLKKLQELNEKEYSPETHRQLEEFKIKNQLIIPIEDDEVEKDKLSLEKSARDWAVICLDEKHSEERLKTIAKETRDTLRKKNIEDYLNNTLDENSANDVFKGLLKSYYIYHEAIKIMDTITSKNEPKVFTLNAMTFEINHYSLVHVLNRHFAETLSSQSIITSKSFHNTKINPYTLHLFIDELISLLKTKGIENSIVVQKGQAILIKFHGIDYALYFNEYKLDKSKIILETFFVIESTNPKAIRLIDRLENSQIIELNNYLSIYVE